MQKRSILFSLLFVVVLASLVYYMWRDFFKDTKNTVDGGAETDAQVPEDWIGLAADGISLSYPPDFVVESGTGLGGGYIGTSVLKVAFPGGYFDAENTNFVEAFILISKTANQDALSRCADFTDVQNSVSEIGGRVVRGVSFRTLTALGVAAGSRYESRLYRAVRGDQCFEIALTLHTGDRENYSPPVREFEKSQAFDVLEDILSTVKFIRN
jgi:hypothetical protein